MAFLDIFPNTLCTLLFIFFFLITLFNYVLYVDYVTLFSTRNLHQIWWAETDGGLAIPRCYITLHGDGYVTVVCPPAFSQLPSP